jgi:hypothetical protein
MKGGKIPLRRWKMVGEPVETIKIDTSADYDFLYEGLSRQSIDFHQAVAELVDNAISAKSQVFATSSINH